MSAATHLDRVQAGPYSADPVPPDEPPVRVVPRPSRALAITDPGAIRAMSPGASRDPISRSSFAYYEFLAQHAGPDGLTHVSRARAAEHFGVSERTISRWRGELERADLIVREEGGYDAKHAPGQQRDGRTTVIRVITRVTKGLVRRARAAVWAARRERIANRRWPGRRIGDTDVTPTTPKGGEPTSGAGSHPFETNPGDPSDPYCLRCGLPRRNRWHQDPP